MQLGKMYLIKGFYFLFPTKELAASSSRAVEVYARWGARGALWRRWGAEAEHEAKWLSRLYKCNVAVVKENTYFVLLEIDEDAYIYKLLDCNGNVGWIYQRNMRLGKTYLFTERAPLQMP